MNIKVTQLLRFMATTLWLFAVAYNNLLCEQPDAAQTANLWLGFTAVAAVLHILTGKHLRHGSYENKQIAFYSHGVFVVEISAIRFIQDCHHESAFVIWAMLVAFDLALLLDDLFHLKRDRSG